MTNKRNSLLLSIFSNWTALLTAVLVGFFLTSYIISQLGKTGFGIWTLISSLVGYYGVLDLGVESAVTRYVARDAGRRDYTALNSTINTALALFVGVGSVVILLSLVLGEPLTVFFAVEAAHAADFESLIIILGLSMGLSFPGNLFSATLKAHERFLEANLVNISGILLRALLVIGFLSQNWGLPGLAYATLISAMLTLALNYWFCRRLFPYVHFNLFGGNTLVLRTLLTFGIATTVIEVASILRFNLDSFVIGKMMDLASVGVFGVAALLMRYFLQFISSATISVFTPRFSHLEGEGETAMLKALYVKSLGIGAFLSFGVATPIMIYGEQFVKIWAGDEFVDAVPVLWLLTVSFAVTLAQSTSVAMMYALHKHQIFAVVSLAEGVANVALSVYLAPDYGLLGVALGTAIPMIFVKVILQPLYLTRIIDVPLWPYVWSLLPPLLLFIALVGSAFYLPSLVPEVRGYLGLLLWGLPLLFPFMLLYGALYPADRQQLWARLAPRLGFSKVSQ